MLRHIALTTIVLSACVLVGAVAVQNQPAPVAPASTAALELPAFFAGTWRASIDKNFVEEIWSEAHGNNMMGAFRWFGGDNEVAMLELISITKETDATRLRLRHTNRTMVAKEPIDKPMVFKLVELTKTRAVFESEKDTGDASRLVYDRTGDQLVATVEFGRAVEKRDPLTLTFKRAQ